MTAIISYTTVDQSCKLAEFLSFESADYHYIAQGEKSYFYPYSLSSDAIKHYDENIKYIPCWSLAMLLRILDDAAANIDEDGYVDAVVCRDSCSITLINCDDKFEEASNLVDACVKMITRLNELNLL